MEAMTCITKKCWRKDLWQSYTPTKPKLHPLHLPKRKIKNQKERKKKNVTLYCLFLVCFVNKKMSKRLYSIPLSGFDIQYRKKIVA